MRLLMPLLLLCASGCVARFDTVKVSQLKLTQSSIAQAHHIFGKPDSSGPIQGEPRTTLLTYLNYRVFPAKITGVLTLEFIDDKLNGYMMNGQKGGETPLPAQQLAPELKKGAVIRMLGAPIGEAHCPTSLQRNCTAGSFAHFSSQKELIEVAFDQNNVVSRITRSLHSISKDPPAGTWPPNTWVVAGKTRRAELEAKLGQAHSGVQSKDGQILRYSWGGTNLIKLLIKKADGISIRAFSAEVENDLVRSFVVLSTKNVPLGKAPQLDLIKTGMSEREVQQACGAPHGRIACPSKLEKDCPHAAMLLWWITSPLLEKKATARRVHLDAQGKVVAVE